MNCDNVKTALRRRHPGESNGSMPGQWTCIEEWMGIDLLALNAWQKADVIGYEVKVSRSDMRRELLRPWKRADAVAMTTEFYFAVPHGIYKLEEIAYEEPEWEEGDFERQPCPGVDEIRIERRYGSRKIGGGSCRKLRNGTKWSYNDVPTGYLVRLPVPVVLRGIGQRYVNGELVSDPIPDCHLDDLVEDQGYLWNRCPTCGGTGHNGLSRVERDAPTLWVPRDVGLIEVRSSGCYVIKRSPRRKAPESIAKSQQHLNDLVRWVSHRPDPRHISRVQNRIDVA